jgi:hypothetical protein
MLVPLLCHICQIILMLAMPFIISIFMTTGDNMCIRRLDFEVFEPNHVSAGSGLIKHA